MTVGGQLGLLSGDKIQTNRLVEKFVGVTCLCVHVAFAHETYNARTSSTTGITRRVFAWYSAKPGIRAAWTA